VTAPINKQCEACGKLMPPQLHGSRKQCLIECHKRPAPAVYSFTCPDGRVYVGSAGCQLRNGMGERRKLLPVSYR
jgi:hypothetical protein